MKPLLLYLCLPAILFQVIFASTSLNESASLSTNMAASSKSRKPYSKAKPAVGKLVCKKKLLSSKKKAQNKRSKNSKSVLFKENRSKLLIELLLLKELVEIVIGYFDDDTYPFIVFTHNWALEEIPMIAVDSARLYVIAEAEGIKGLDHPLANVKENERRLIEFGDPKWSDYSQFRSSHDGRYVSFGHNYKVLTDQGEHAKLSTKWLMQSNEPEGGRIKRITFDGEESPYGLLSRDGQTLCAYSDGMNPITRVYRLREEAEDPVVFMKCELNGSARAVSGNGNRVTVVKAEQLEIHDISKDANKLVCQINVTGAIYAWTLNEDGSEAAFVDSFNALLIVGVDNVSGPAMNQSAIVTVKVSESVGRIYKLVYSDGGKLHVLHVGGKVSLFDPLTKELILLEAPQEGQEVGNWKISSNADYIAVIRHVGKGENGKAVYETIVKRKCKDSDWKDLFGCEVGKNKQAAK